MGVLYSNDRLLAHLALTLALSKGMATKILFVKKLQFVYIADAMQRVMRKLFFNIFLAAKLLQKVIRAQNQAHTVSVEGDFLSNKPIGIIVRTDSEVVSASHLIKTLQGEGIPYLLIHDEVVASTTTLKRMKTFGYKGVAIGSMLGLKGVLRALLSKRPRLNLSAPVLAPEIVSIAEQILLRNEQVLSHLKNRLNDFYFIQRHFFLELTEIIDRYQIGVLVTYAYVDQWGGVVKAAGDQSNIQTLAIQNAAQDPEEFPRLCWADNYCVESMYLKRKLVSLGYPANKLVATGLPHFSSFDPGFYQRKKNNIQDIRVLIIAQPIYQTYFELILQSCIEFSKESRIKLAIKYHPRQRGNEYEEIIQRNAIGIPVEIYTNESLDDLIVNSSVVISVVSAALIRSINIGTPTISYLPLEERHLDLYYANDENLYCVATKEELIGLLRKMTSDGESFRNGFETRRNHYLTEHAHFEPTNSPDANILMTLLKLRSDRDCQS